MSKPCPPVTASVRPVTVTVNAKGKPSFSVNPIVVEQADTLIVFTLNAPDYRFPTDGSALQVSGTDTPSRDAADGQFPMAWLIDERTLALQDRNDSALAPSLRFACTVSVEHIQTGERSSHDPGIENNNQR